MKEILLLIQSALLFIQPILAQNNSDPKPANLQPVGDYLWLLEVDNTNLSLEYRELQKKLSKSIVPTIDKAQSIALESKLKAAGLLAEEGALVIALIKIGVEVPEFAHLGDLVWVVHILNYLFGGTVTQEMWISSTTGKVKYMIPFEGLKQ